MSHLGYTCDRCKEPISSEEMVAPAEFSEPPQPFYRASLFSRLRNFTFDLCGDCSVAAAHFLGYPEQPLGDSERPICPKPQCALYADHASDCSDKFC